MRRRTWPHIAEVDPAMNDAVLVLKTLNDPDHYDLLGDRGDMLDCVIRIAPGPVP